MQNVRSYLPKLSSHIPSWLRISVVGLLVIATLLLVTARVTESFTRTAVVADDRILQLQDEEQTLNLALEFGFDPMIVQVTRRLAADAISKHQCACPTWRFVRTDYDLTYLLLSLVQTESHGNYAAFNPAGKAYGLTQLLMSTARQYDKTITEPELLTIPRNLDIAMVHFVALLEKYRGNSTLAVLAWNGGQGTVDRLVALGSPQGEYARTVYTRAAMRNATR